MTGRDITICMAYYINPGMLSFQYGHLKSLDSALKKHLCYIVVDDGSPVHPAFLPDEDLGLSVEVYRHLEDIPWNQDAARNLAVQQAKTKWILMTDIDHVPSIKLLNRLVTDEKLQPDCAYTFRRQNAPNLEPYKPHPNSWFMTKEMYNNIGGYDERYRGVYGTDGMFLRRVHKNARKVLECKEALIRYPRDVIPDASTTTLTRRSAENEALRISLRGRYGETNPVRGLTPWTRVN